MFREYNPNPSNKRVGDCVVRAISKALNQSWRETYIDLTIQGYLMSDLLSSNAVWGAYLKSKGFIRDIVSADCPDCYTVKDFCEEHPCGVYVIGTGRIVSLLSMGVFLTRGCQAMKHRYIIIIKENDYGLSKLLQ